MSTVWSIVKTKIKRRSRRRRNFIARALRNPLFRPRIIDDKRLKNEKRRMRQELRDYDNNSNEGG